MRQSVANLSVIILTYNEEQHIERAIRSLAPLETKIFVVDSFSTDRTCDIATALGAEIVRHPFVTQSQQFRWALNNLPIKTEWVMRLDADELLTPELALEIAGRLFQLPIDVRGVMLRRRHIFMGRLIRYGGRYPLIQLRIWRKGAAIVEDCWMDEHMVLLDGAAITFKYDFIDANLGDLTSFIRKHNAYATRATIDVLGKKYKLFATRYDHPTKYSSMDVVSAHEMKYKIYGIFPKWVGPFSYYLFRYFLQLGFLDGHEGMIYHFLQGFWYRFLVDAKIEEFDRILRTLPDLKSRRNELARLSGYSMADTVFGDSDEPEMAVD